MVELVAPANSIKASLSVSGSKSISNRVLILNDVFKTQGSLTNLSDAEDTVLLQQALQQIQTSRSGIININHAGTDMRFLTALLSVTAGVWTLTGSERIKQRPVAELVSALQSLGAEITYLENENFPPLKITGKKIAGGKVAIDAGVSSQFVSALLLIAPAFENGLELTLKNKIVSRPYINMTISLLKKWGVQVVEEGSVISVIPSLQSTVSSSQEIESDWSSASYWYSVCALAPGAEIELSNFNENSLQADSVLPGIYNTLGVQTVFKNGSIFLSRKKVSTSAFNYDFTNCPDIAQTIAVTCVGLGISGTLTGLQTLKLKETDRITALKNELEKTGAVVEVNDQSIKIEPAPIGSNRFNGSVTTYHDHRMAMSFAPLALVYGNIKIEDPQVVSKSYPRFWEDLKSVGFNVDLQP